MRIREWLNREGFHSTGFVYVDTEEDHILRIGDCNRQIDLSLASWDLEQAKNTLEKLDTLIWAAKEAQREVRKICNQHRRKS